MDDIQRFYRDKLTTILELPTNPRLKSLLLSGLLSQLRELQDQNRSPDQPRGKFNYEVLSTAFSECQSTSYQTEKDIQQLQEKILQLRTVKFEKNEHIQQLQQQLDDLEKTVRARSEYNDHLKRKMVMRMEQIQNQQKTEKEKEKSMLNKSIDAVAGILTFKWW